MSVFKVLMQEFCKKLQSQIYNSRLYLSAYAMLQHTAASSAINEPTLPTRPRE